MKPRTIIPILLIVAMFLAACTAKSSQDIADEADAYLTTLASEQGFSGAVLIAREGEILIGKGYGMADRENQVPNTLQTRYRIHMVTMPFTAIAILQLQEDGKLDVQDAICEYIPDCPEHWQGISLHHLLTHTSGVSDWVQAWETAADKPTTGLERVALIQGKAPYFEPGSQLRYSENGYILLGAVIEQTSGETYDEYIQMHILSPLGMQNSGYEGTGLAANYEADGERIPEPDVLFRYSASGLYASVEDLYLLDQALYKEGLLSQASLAQMFHGYALTPSMDFKGAEYGYGWFVGQLLDREVIFHGGGMRGYTAMILRFPEERVTIIVLRNYGIPLYDRLEIELAQIVFGEKQ